MPKKIPEFLNYFLMDCLEWDNSFSKKAMFSWYAIYKNKKVFCLYLNDVIYFKVWENNMEDYKKCNSRAFSYPKKDWKIGVLSYYELPENILENREELNKWIGKSLSVVNKIKAKKKSKKDVELDNKILKALLKIPKWKVTTYKILADKFWVHPRRIASVMKYNKSPENYPCYKVISHSLRVWWYSAFDWVDSKIEMLEDDWVKVVDGKIPENYIFSY
jgi:DNA transformation protein